MNAYPAELVQHHYACMLVAGLTGSPSSSQPSSQPPLAQAQVPPSEQQHQQAQSSTTAAPAAAINGPGSPSSSPPRPLAPKREEAAAVGQEGHAAPTPTPTQAFPELCRDLCEVFDSRGRGTAWDPAKGQSAVFHSVLVDANVRLPPRKTRPTPRTLSSASPEQQSIINNLPPRSPLSPLHPSSPLFPDGLVAPIWMRKHRELVPAIFVGFHCLAEPPPPPLPKKDKKKEEGEEMAKEGDGEKEEGEGEKQQPDDFEASMAKAGQELKRRDEELIKQIADRKRTLSERGIKLTVVLLTTRSMLESPALETRLSYIRRSSMLDSRASLFVLTPVSKPELNEFVTSLQSALYDPALDYYREHMRRARRKRARYPPPSSLVTQIMTAAAQLRGNNMPIKDPPLSREGWLVRNDVKLGTFAELSANLAEALQHYETAYHSLSTELLTSTLLLPPRTKRWAEAKVLADTLSVRISKLHLYANDGEAAWRQFRLHIKRFTELSQGWGIGEMTFEFWSWLGKQYRLMGDLLDLGTRPMAGSPLPAFEVPQHHPPLPPFLLHPSHLPMPTASGQHYPQVYNPQHGPLLPPNEAAVQSGVAPAAMCPGPGECFYLAGLCALERWSRFKKLSEGAAGKEDDGQWSVLAQEKKVDHAAQAIDVFTRAYELFKRLGKIRLSLGVASKIANAYLESGQHEMALRFLERIVKTYRVEGWEAPLTSLLLQSFECATQVGDVESQGRALLELCRPSSETLTDEQRDQVRDELQRWWRQHESQTPLEVAAESVDGALCVEFVFLKPKIDLGVEPAVFQLRLSCPDDSALPPVAFTEARIYLEGESEDPIVIRGQADVKGESASQIANVGVIDLNRRSDVGTTVDLRWGRGVTRILQGALRADWPQAIRISRVVLASPAVELAFNLPVADEVPLLQPFQPHWVISADPLRLVDLRHRQEEACVVAVSRKKHNIRVEVVHEEFAYLDEDLVVTIRLHNDEESPREGEEEVDCSVDVVLQSGEAKLVCEEQESIAMLQGIAFDKIKSGSMVEKTFTARVSQVAAFEVVVRASSTVAPTGSHAAETHTSELLHHLSLGLRPAFSCQFSAAWRVGEAKSRQITPPSNSNSNSNSNGGGGGGTTTPDSDSGSEVDGVSSLGINLDQAPVSTIAAVNACLNVTAPTMLVIETVELVLDPANKYLRQLEDQESEAGVVGGEWIRGDRWGGVYDVEVLSAGPVSNTEEQETVGPTGHLEVTWRRSTSSSSAAGVTTTRLPLPLLVPPHLLARLVVSAAPVASLEAPLVVLLSLVNPSKKSAVDVFVVLDEHERSAFHLSGPRSFTVPNLLPRSTRSVPVQMYARAEGLQYLPRIRAWQKERAEKQGQQGPAGAATIINETQGGGVPLEVRFRHGTGAASLSAVGQKALAQLQVAQQAQPSSSMKEWRDRRNSSLAVLIHGPGGASGAEAAQQQRHQTS